MRQVCECREVAGGRFFESGFCGGDREGETAFLIGAVIVTLLVPSVPNLRVEFIPGHIPNNQLLMSKLFEILAEKGSNANLRVASCATKPAKHCPPVGI